MIWWKLRQLKSANPETKGAAIKALAKIGTARALLALERVLQHPKVLDRFWDMDSKTLWIQTVQALIQVGTEPARHVATAAVVAAAVDGRLDGAGSLNALRAIKFLPSNAEELAACCLIGRDWAGLMTIGSASVPLLISHLKHQPGRRSQVIVTLGVIADKRAIGPLLPYLHGDTRWEAAFALGRMGESTALDSLLYYLNHESTWTRLFEQGEVTLRLTIVGALDALGWQPADDAQRARYAMASDDWDEVIKLPVAVAVEQLMSVVLNVHFDREITHQAIGTLGRIASDEAVEALTFIYETSMNMEANTDEDGDNIYSVRLGRATLTKYAEHPYLTLAEKSGYIGKEAWINRQEKYILPTSAALRAIAALREGA